MRRVHSVQTALNSTAPRLARDRRAVAQLGSGDLRLDAVIYLAIDLKEP
jgi:hypothetical protein